MSGQPGEAGFAQHTCVAFDVFLHCDAAKMRAFGQDLLTSTTAQMRRTEHVFPRRHGLIEYVCIDLALKCVIGSGIAGIGDAALTMAEMLSESEQGGTVTKCGKAGEGLAPLVRR